jgi:hypothetical protein
VKVAFQFTLDDLVDTAERAAGRSGVVRSWRWQGMALSCLFSAAVAYVLVPGSMERRITAAVVGAIVCAAIYPFTSGRSRKTRLLKLFREQFGGDGPYACEVELLESGVATTQAGTRSLREWPAITAVEDTPDSVDFITRAAGSIVVRNRAFRSADERKQFLELARRYLRR